MQRADFLSGSLVIERGERADYRALAHLHYVPGDPATIAGVWRAVWRDFGLGILDVGLDSNPKSAIQNPKSIPRVVGVCVLSYPTSSSSRRERALGLRGPRYGHRLRWINANLRTISRVIVHPQFRALGIASSLVRRALEECPVRYVEAFAVMGRIVPFFQRAGMREVEEGYFLFDGEEVGMR